MQVADRGKSSETLTPRTGIEVRGRPEDTAGGRVAPQTRRDFLYPRKARKCLPINKREKP